MSQSYNRKRPRKDDGSRSDNDGEGNRSTSESLTSSAYSKEEYNTLQQAALILGLPVSDLANKSRKLHSPSTQTSNREEPWTHIGVAGQSTPPSRTNNPHSYTGLEPSTVGSRTFSSTSSSGWAFEEEGNFTRQGWPSVDWLDKESVADTTCSSSVLEECQKVDFHFSHGTQEVWPDALTAPQVIASSDLYAPLIRSEKVPAVRGIGRVGCGSIGLMGEELKDWKQLDVEKQTDTVLRTQMSLPPPFQASASLPNAHGGSHDGEFAHDLSSSLIHNTVQTTGPLVGYPGDALDLINIAPGPDHFALPTRLHTPQLQLSNRMRSEAPANTRSDLPNLTKPRKQRRRQPFSDPRKRSETGETRKRAACIRCHMQRIRVSFQGPEHASFEWRAHLIQCIPDENDPSGDCQTCVKVSGPAAYRNPCLRYKISEISLFAKGDHPRYEWTQRWRTMKIVEIGEWQSPQLKKVDITQDVGGQFYQVEARRFIPRFGDSLERKWTTNGSQMAYQCTPYAIANMEETSTKLENFVKSTLLSSVEHYIDETDSLLRQTYVMAEKLSHFAKVRSSTLKQECADLLARHKRSGPCYRMS